MATLVLSAVGQAAGGLLGPVGAIVGRAAGGLAGSLVDQRLFGDSTRREYGRLDDLSVQSGSEGNPIPKVYGRMRLAGTVIWAPDFIERRSTASAGGKGGGPQVTEYSYTANFAVGIAEGVVARVGRICADGEPLDLNDVTWRFHSGEADQAVDPLIAAVEGVTPAFRGLAYVVIEALPIGRYGNRLPQLTFEVIRPIGALEKHVRAVTMIPGATEFGYHPERIDRVIGPGEVVADNRHIGTAQSDFVASLDELQAICPNLERVALVVAWFGSDLRAGHCTLTPRVEARGRETDVPWAVAGENRETAQLVTQTDDVVAYGGTPSDSAVVAAIKELNERGLKVVFYPFILMDVPPENGLPDPYSDGTQAPFPWRGRITGYPAAGRPDATDGTAAAEAEVASFVGDAARDAFRVQNGTVAYTGPEEWTLRRMVLHYAHLCALAGGVDAFLLASELRGLSRLRGSSDYPFVTALTTLAADVRSVVGPDTKISYAADWSEYFGDQRDGDAVFHLDPFWADPNVDFVGIDNYWPLSDWRDGTHLDGASTADIYDPAYLTGNVAGGEGFDWYYASAADRDAQRRTPITDGAAGKPWVFRYKDVVSWWSNAHYDRAGGVESASPTAWQPQMKPIWFTEIGCPAVDRGANQPNVFYDPKSSESALPYHSGGRRDDAMQRAYLGAMIGAFDPADHAMNPMSSVYGAPMLDPSTVHVWTWDARPWPVFPQRDEVWADGPNWARGHWVTGRFGSASIDDLIAALFADWGVPVPKIAARGIVLDGYVVSDPISLRGALEPLLEATSIVAADTGTAVRFSRLDQPVVAELTPPELVEMAREPVVSERRDEVFALPVEQRLRYLDSGRSFQIASARYRPFASSERQVDQISLPAAMNDGLASDLAQLALSARWAARTSVQFSLPPSAIQLVPGNVVRLNDEDRTRDILIEEIEDVERRIVRGRTRDLAQTVATGREATFERPPSPPTFAAPATLVLDLPILSESRPAQDIYLGVFARPWPETMGVWEASTNGPFRYRQGIDRPASVGEVVVPAPAGPTSRWHSAGTMIVTLRIGSLSSASLADVLNGENALAVQATNGDWEVLQFRCATLIEERTYRLDGLLRGTLGTEIATRAGHIAGAPLALLDGMLAPFSVNRDRLGITAQLRIGPAAEGLGGRNTTTLSYTPRGRGLVPYAPTHGRASRDQSGAVVVTWIRRTRIGGDARPDDGDVPLGESEELYRLDVLAGATVVRTADLSVPEFTYTRAEQIADFGTELDAVGVRIRQIAPGFGPGDPYEDVLNVK